MTSRLVLTENTLSLLDASLVHGGGRLNGELNLRVDALDSGDFSISIENIAARSLLFLWPELARQVESRIYTTMRGQLSGSRLSGSGQVQLTSGRIAGVPVSNLRAPLNWSYDASAGVGSAQVTLSRASVSRGRVKGKATLSWGRQLRLDGRLTFSDVALRPFARHLSDLPDDFAGRLSGEVELEGRNVTGLDSLSGRFRLEVDNAQVLKLPVMDRLPGRYLVASPGESFTQSEVHGTLRRGVIFVEKMTLVASRIHIFIHGKATTAGTLDFDIVADTAELQAVAAVVGLIRPTDLLRTRLIFLHMGGNVDNPIIRPQTEKFVAQEVELFFLSFLIL